MTTSMTIRPAALLALLLVTSLAHASGEAACAAAFKAESDRILRDAERRAAANPPGKDQKAQQQFMIPIHDALKAAGRKADDCERQARRNSPAYAASQAAAHAEIRTRQCNEHFDRELASLRRRDAGNTAEEKRIADDRAACLRQAAQTGR